MNFKQVTCDINNLIYQDLCYLNYTKADSSKTCMNFSLLRLMKTIIIVCTTNCLPLRTLAVSYFS